jgi:hypothetical protein
VETINNKGPEEVRDRVPFDYLTPLFPFEKAEPFHDTERLFHPDHRSVHADRERTARIDRRPAKDG